MGPSDLGFDDPIGHDVTLDSRKWETLNAKESAMTDLDVANEIVSTLRSWVNEEVIPHASEFELPDEYPTQMALQMASFGLFGATIPAVSR